MAEIQEGPGDLSATGADGSRPTFGEGDLLSGDFFRGPLVVSQDENIRENIEGIDEDAGTIEGADVNPQVEETIEDLSNPDPDAFWSGFRAVTLDPAEEAADEARNIGPDWLDEATGAGVLIALLLAGAWVLRPFAKAVS